MKSVIALCVFLALATGAHAADPAPASIQALAFVVLAEPALPSAEKVAASLRTRLGDAQPVTAVSAQDPQAFVMRVSGGTVTVMLADRPIPNQELDHICRQAWYWKTACEAVAAHRAHLVVTLMGTTLGKVDAALLLTQVMASLMDANAIASYWGESLQSRDDFLRQGASASRERLPIMLWVHFRLSHDPLAGWAISTSGMQGFGLLEIECRNAPVDGRSLFGLAAGMVNYLLTKGPVIQDGDTIGESASQSIVVRKAPSYWNPGQTVYRIAYP
ncbi:MAG: DUF4261 domain-containing protein [Ramlibacter sp.]